MKLTLEEKQLLVTALQMRICYIETGDITLTARDAERMGGVGIDGPVKIKALSEDQMRLIINMRDLSRKILEA